jgi:hypothetical protein
MKVVCRRQTPRGPLVCRVEQSPWSRPVPETQGRLPVDYCPWCGAKCDAWTALDPCRSPKAGDAGMCFYCGQVMIYNTDLTLRKPDEVEAILWAADPTIRRTRRAWEIFVLRHPEKRREPK